MSKILTPDWWLAAGQRAAYTALAVLLPVAMQLVTGEVSATFALSAMGLAAVASLATSLAGLPELTDAVRTPWVAILSRVAKTAGQSLVAAIGTAYLLSDVAWTEVWQVVAGASLTTLLRTILDVIALPETTPIETIVVEGDVSE